MKLRTFRLILHNNWCVFTADVANFMAVSGAGLNTDVVLMRLFKQEWSVLNKADRREGEEMVRDITLVTVMQQTSLSVYTIIL